MPKKIRAIHIERNDDGSHTVRHEFHPVAKKGSGTSIAYEHVKEESKGFGPGEKEQHRMLTHIAQTLGFKKVAEAEGAEDQEMERE